MTSRCELDVDPAFDLSKSIDNVNTFATIRQMDIRLDPSGDTFVRDADKAELYVVHVEFAADCILLVSARRP